MPQIDYSVYDNQYYWYIYYISSWAGSKTWAATDWFKSHIDTFPYRYQYIGITPSAVNLLKDGDIILMDLATSPPTPDHASVIIASSTNGNPPLRDAHCCDRYHVAWDYKMPNGASYWAYQVIY